MTIETRAKVEHLGGGELHPMEPARLRLAALPTTVERLTRLPAARGIDPDRHPLFVKRDDLTGLEVSGNKVRKLEYLVADALAHDADVLVTMGGTQSNHCRATAAVAARLGLGCRLILRGSPGEAPQALAGLSQNSQGNLLLDELFGADVSFHDPAEYNDDRDAMIERVLGALRDKGHRPYFFATGGSVAMGCWGYIRAIFELAEQHKPALGDRPVDVVCCNGSGGTHAGCVLGRALAGPAHWRIVGVPIAGTADGMAADTRTLINETIAAFGLNLTAADTPVEVLDGFIGPGYAIPTPEGTAAIRDAARLEGLVLDPSYTGKTMAAALHALATGGVRDGAATVVLHTGGAFGLMGAAASPAGWSA